MQNLNPAEIWAVILAAASAFVLISNAVEKIVRAVKAAKAPNDRQNERLDELERELEEVKRKLNRDNDRLGDMDKGSRATMHAILALLDHGIDGNNIDQMKAAKVELLTYLID
jgi:hypothetical protein